MSEFSQIPDQSHTDILSRPLVATMSLDLEKFIYLVIVILALVTRLWGIGDRVVSHDESLHTQYSYQYYNGDGYEHTALMHGPSLFHVTALSYWLFGVSDASARIPVAIVGTLLVFLPYFLRGWVGRVGALVASFMLLISPYISYYSRYVRHDIYVITSAVILFITIQHYLRKREEKTIWWFAIGLGLMFTTMETAYIYVAIFGSFLALALVAKIIVAPWFRETLPKLRWPLVLVGASLLLILGGFAVQRVAPRVLEETTPSPDASTEEGFAADPNQALPTPVAGELENRTITAARWVQVGGLILLSAGLLLSANAMRPRIDEFAEFDLVVLFTSLTLPTVTAFLVVLVGRNPLAFRVDACQLAGQETMSALQLSFARFFDATCRATYFTPDFVVSAGFLVLTLAASVLVGLWWHRRRWLIAAAIFNGIFILLFTSLFTNPPGWTSGVIGSLGYWLEQQGVQRANQPWYFYFVVLPLYEFLPLLFTLVAAHFWAKKHRLSKIVGYWLILALIALFAHSLTNWFVNRELLNPDDFNKLPAQLVAAFILAVGAIYWFLVRQRQIKAEYQLERWRELVSTRTLFGFVPYLLWWFVLTWVIYGLAGEKMAWLSSHFILPMVLLTGWYINEKMVSANMRELLSGRFALLVALTAVLLLTVGIALAPALLGRITLFGQEASNLTGLGRFLGSLLVAGILFYFLRQAGKVVEKGTRRRALLVAVFGLLALLTIRFSYMASFQNADYVTEYLVYAHGAPATKSEVLDELEQLSMRLHGDKSIKVAYDNDSSWPYTWYLRDYPNRIYFGENPGRNITEAPVVIVGNQNWNSVEPLLGDDYDSRTYTFLWWPMEEYRKISWNAILGDPLVEADQRRGLGDPNARQALWDIFFYRDYEKYGEVFGGTYTAGQWPLRHELRMYIRKDTLATIWDHGVDAVAAEPPVDPYAENELQPIPSLVVGTQGIGEGQLMQPRNLAVGDDGLLYVADSGNHRIQVFDSDGNYVRSWGSFGSEPGLFNEPWSVAVDEDFVYVADTWNHRLQKFTLEGELVDVIGQSGSPGDGQSGGGLFFGPRDIAILPDGNLLVTDTGNHRLQVLDPDGNFITAVGSQGNAPGQFYEPVGLSLGPGGSVFLADTWNGRIQELSADLLPLSSWSVDAWYGDSINNKPYLAIDAEGRIYVTDPEGYRVLVFDQTGQYLGRFGQFGVGLDGFGLPNGIRADSAGNIYVVDSGNSRILKYSALDLASPGLSGQG